MQVWKDPVHGSSCMKRKKKLVIPQLTLDRSSNTSLYLQVRDQLAAAIRAGEIPVDATLPSSRLLAGLLGVSRNTVLTAYDELVAEGLADARPGSGINAAGAGQTPSFNVADLLRAAHYPARFVRLTDPDGTLINLSF